MTMQEKFKSHLQKLSKEELVDRFNREVGNRGWVSARAIYLSELRAAMKNSGLDITTVLNSSGGFNLNRKVRLDRSNSSLVHLSSQT